MARARLSLHVVAPCLGVSVALWAGCGAESSLAPPPEPVAEVSQCRSFEQLMPRFVQVVREGRLSGLAAIVREQLSTPAGQGTPSPAGELLRSLLTLLGSLTKEPREASAPEGQLCDFSPAAPAPKDANTLCVVRRLGRSMVESRQGLEMLQLVDPQISGVLRYVLGGSRPGARPHLEVASVLSSMTRQSEVCSLSEGLTLVATLAEYLESSEGRPMLERLVALVENPTVRALLSDDGQRVGGEDGFVALARFLSHAVIHLQSGEDLARLPLDELPPQTLELVRPLLRELSTLIAGEGGAERQRALRSVLVCHATHDRDDALARMFFHLVFVEKRAEFGLTRLVRLAHDLRAMDEQGAFAHVTARLARSLVQDEVVVRAAAHVLGTLLSAENAEVALPALLEVFDQRLVAELLCALDTLVFGCAGGPQPACLPPPAVE